MAARCVLLDVGAMKRDHFGPHDPLTDVVVFVLWLALLIAAFSYW